MPDLYSPEEDAARYVLNEFSAVERRDFEARLRDSSELRLLVRELEEGLLALSITCPPRRAPAQTWARIEKSLAHKSRRESLVQFFWKSWARSGWAAATACLVGWLLYAIWAANRTGSSNTRFVPSATEVKSQQPIIVSETPRVKAEIHSRADRAQITVPIEVLQARTQEIRALQGQVAELTNQMIHFSQMLTHQQELLSEASRIKFFQLTLPTADADNTATKQVSPELQRALMLAMARTLGWATSNPFSQLGGAQSLMNHSGVDFVDLRPASNSPPASTSLPRQTEAPPSTASESSSLTASSTSTALPGVSGINALVELPPASSSVPSSAVSSEQVQLPPNNASESTWLTPSSATNGIPGFVSGTIAVMAFDSSVVTQGASLSFWTSTSSGPFQSLGTAIVRDNPLAVTIPFTSSSFGDGSITVFSTTPNGGSNILGQFSTRGLLTP